MKLLWAAPGLLIGGLLAAVVGLGHPVMGSAAASGMQQTVGAAGAVGVRFNSQSVTEGGQPVLPSGSLAISRQQAIQTAMKESDAVNGQSLLPNVQMVARYGTFSDDQYARMGTSGTRVPVYQDRPVWLVTFSGSGLTVPIGTTGLLSGQGADVPATPLHEENIAVDAVTGQFLELYAYQ